MKSHLVQLRKSFAGKAVNFEFGPDDPQYKILKEFQNDQLAQLYDMAPPGQEHHGPASRGQPSETYSHSYRVANDVYMFAAYIGLSEQIARNLRWCVLLHDIGKMDVPTEIFHKPGRLTPEEFIEIKRHTQYGADRIRKSGISHPIIELATEIALYHHERPDGHGYYGLSDKKVPSRIRLVQLCDIYDALSAPRMYRRADEELSIYNAMKNILDPHGWKFKEVDQMFARPFCLLKLNLLEADLSKEDHKMLEEYLI
ncbi:MAG: two-component system response regulator, partial [Alphaproteobacteria bacterium]|nr:two-component system response regulator [Alphaproteobacteria bacterium]